MGMKNAETVGCRKAGIALTAALSCFLLYVLACVFSSPSWSPDSAGIALLVMSGDIKDPEQFAIFAYDIRTDEHVLLDRVDANGLLANPSWSPDGKWIAYYRLRRPPSQEADSPAPTDAPGSEPNQTTGAGQAAGQPAASAAAAVKLFSEENRMLPPFVFDALKERTEDKGGEILSMELVAVTPDGKDRKILLTLQCPDLKGDDLTVLALLRPEWSKDSKRLFYARPIGDDSYYIAGLDLATGQTYAYFVSIDGTLAISPDGDWMASLLKGDSKQVLLSLTRTDGSVQKYFRLDADIDDGSESSSEIVQLSWSPDSKSVLVSLDELRIVDVITGRMRTYHDPEADEIGFGVFSPRGERLYYLAQFAGTDPNAEGEKATLKSCDLESGKTQTVFTISDIPAYSGMGRFSISPDGKAISLWCSVEEADEDGEAVLLLWDGKTRKMIRTGRWLPKPVESASTSPAEQENSKR